MSPREKPVTVFVMGAVIATLVAAIWAIINYVSHLDVNPLYKSEPDDIHRQTMFQQANHQYLFFWGSVEVLVGVISFILAYTIHALRTPVFIDIGVTLVIYGVGFYLSFFMYLLLDKLLANKK